jgi:hypothetical protein
MIRTVLPNGTPFTPLLKGTVTYNRAVSRSTLAAILLLTAACGEPKTQRISSGVRISKSSYIIPGRIVVLKFTADG